MVALESIEMSDILMSDSDLKRYHLKKVYEPL